MSVFLKYNALDLPAEVTFSDGSAITNRYFTARTLDNFKSRNR